MRVMRLTVHKYPLQIGTKVSIELPHGAEILKCAMQGTTPMMWVQKPMAASSYAIRHFQVYGTGWVIDEHTDVRYIDTVFHGTFVWHVYEMVDSTPVR